MAEFNVVIAGGGLSGLHAAYTILSTSAVQLSICLLESTDRLGGRVYSMDKIDLGAAWIWGKNNPKMLDLIKRFHIETEGQEGGHGELRLKGGMACIINELYTNIDDEIVFRMETRLLEVTQPADPNRPIEVKVMGPKLNMPYTIKTNHLIIAYPPRLAVENLRWHFGKSEDNIFTMPFENKSIRSRFRKKSLKDQILKQSIWMAPMGKLALFYREQFWKPESVYGRLPAPQNSSYWGGIQVYDAGTIQKENETYHVLVSFLTWGKTSQIKKLTPELVLDKVVSQIARTFGISINLLGKPAFYNLKCWKIDNEIMSPLIKENYPVHPPPIEGINYNANGKRRIWFGNSEASEKFIGVLEGAIHNSQKVATEIVKRELTRV